MGITGELVRNVFSKKLSIQRHGNHAKSISAERKKWSISVRSYLCGDEHNSSFAADHDQASVNFADSFRSNMATNYASATFISSVYAEAGDSASEATVNQPLHEDNNSKSSEDCNKKENSVSACTLLKQEDAAVVIQSAFKSFKARRARDEDTKREDEKNESPKYSPSRESSIGTSIEVQMGNSSDIFSYNKESFDVCHQTRNRARSQVLKLQEEWDDSKVSSTKSKMRIQNRLEAATRRERALAYAFSQQLRICSKKKQSTMSGAETNMGWNWLERWMATRQPENESMEDHETGSNTNNQNLVAKKRSSMLMMDAGLIEEKESCGSNEVSSLFEVNITNMHKVSVSRPSIPRNKVTRNLSRQNSASSQLCPRESKDSKQVVYMEDEKQKRTKQSGNKRDHAKYNYATTDPVTLELDGRKSNFSFQPDL